MLETLKHLVQPLTRVVGVLSATCHKNNIVCINHKKKKKLKWHMIEMFQHMRFGLVDGALPLVLSSNTTNQSEMEKYGIWNCDFSHEP